MGNLLTQFMEYFNSCSKEQKKKDFEELREYNNYEPIIKLEE